MLLVPTNVRMSSIHGLGVFLLVSVKKGEVVCRFDARVDRVYSESEVSALPQHQKDFFRSHARWHEEKQLWAVDGDEFRYCNHSDTPNLGGHGAFGDFIAAFDLAPGTELTVDYHAICDKTRLTGELDTSKV